MRLGGGAQPCADDHRVTGYQDRCHNSRACVVVVREVVTAALAGRRVGNPEKEKP
jgi:hypothetical protein